MGRFIIRAMTLALVILLIAAGTGIQGYRHARVAYVPLEVLYEIDLSDNVWPDRYYASNYDMPEPRSLHFNGYWTFEPAKNMFGGPVWVFHTNELVLKEVNYTIKQVTR